MAVYVEKPNVHESTMTALKAKDATFTSTPTLQALPLITDNTRKTFLRLSSDTQLCNASNIATYCSIADCVEQSTNANSNHPHDHQWPVDLSALWHKICHTSALHTLLANTLHSSQPVQQPSTSTTDPMDSNNNPFQPDSHHQPVDLLALQAMRDHAANNQCPSIF